MLRGSKKSLLGKFDLKSLLAKKDKGRRPIEADSRG